MYGTMYTKSAFFSGITFYTMYVAELALHIEVDVEFCALYVTFRNVLRKFNALIIVSFVDTVCFSNY